MKSSQAATSINATDPLIPKSVYTIVVKRNSAKIRLQSKLSLKTDSTTTSVIIRLYSASLTYIHQRQFRPATEIHHQHTSMGFRGYTREEKVRDKEDNAAGGKKALYTLQPTLPPTYRPPILQSTFPFTFPSIHPSTHPYHSTHSFFHPSAFLKLLAYYFPSSFLTSIHPLIDRSIRTSVRPSIHPFTFQSTFPSIHSSITPSVCPPIHLLIQSSTLKWHE